MAGIRYVIEPGDEAAAQSATVWAQRFYSDVSARLEAGAVSLASDERDALALRVIWQSLLANEKNLARGAGRRAVVLETLLR